MKPSVRTRYLSSTPAALARLIGILAIAFALLFPAGCRKEDKTTESPPPPSPASTTTTTTLATTMTSMTSMTSKQPVRPFSANTTIAVIPKGTTHEFWKSVHAGADDAGREFGVKINWKGPTREDQSDEQIAIVESFVSDRVAGIVLAPLDSAALVAPVIGAGEKKIPVVIIDSPLKGKAGTDFVSLVATDNYKGGVAGGEELAKALGDGPKKVVLLRYAVGSASTEAREKGFLDTIAKHANLKMISDNQYAGATQAEAQTAADNLMDKLKEADGVFCSNESATQGMLNSLQANHLAGKIKFVGFDASGPLVDAVKSGDIVALIAQNPRNMGYLGVKTMVQQLRGETPAQSIDTGSAVITKETLETEAVKKLLGAQ